MTDVHDPIGDDASLALSPTPPPPVLEASPKERRRFTPKSLAITFVVVLAAVVGGTLVAHALNNNSSSDEAMGNWMASYGSHYLGVSHDDAAVNSATNPTSLRPACLKLQRDVALAQSDPAMPLSSLESQWSVILSNLSTSAKDCVKGIDQQDSNLLNTAQNHMNNATAAYLRLVKAIPQAG